jgi:hypothetical protein
VKTPLVTVDFAIANQARLLRFCKANQACLRPDSRILVSLRGFIFLTQKPHGASFASPKTIQDKN